MSSVPAGRPAAWRATRALVPTLDRGELGIWLLSIGMVAGAAALLTLGGVGGLQPARATMHLPVWSLLIGFAAAEQLVVHVHFRRSAHSMSMGEIPLVFGLLFAGGWTVVIAFTVGRALVLLLVRRLPPIRLAFNVGQFAFCACLTVLVFHVVAGGSGTIDPRLWVATGAATLAGSAFVVVMITTAISLSEGRLSTERFVASLRTDMLVTIASTSIGLCAARLVENDWRTAVLLIVPVLGMFATMRAYAAERARHGRLEFLYEAAQALSSAAGTEEALRSLLERSLTAFRTEVAELVVFSPDGEQALRTTVASDGRATLLEPIDTALAGRLRVALRDRTATCATAELTDPELADYLRSRGIASGLFAPLRGEHACIGLLAIGEPSGVVDTFNGQDATLLGTLAANTSVTLENNRLGQTVWQLERLQADLEHQASHDPLTDLGNRALFGRRLDEAIADGGEAAVIFIDVNDFKMVNDTLGHAAGDELLVAIAGRLADCVRPSDTLARLGGDEFAILLEHQPTQAQAVEIAERIDGRMEERFSIGGQLHAVRVSIGIALGDASGMTSEQLLRNADLAMYRAKQDKAPGYQLFEPGMEVPVLNRHGLCLRLREAARRDAFDVSYQPIVDLGTGEVTAREALVRWTDGPRGRLSPASFIPIAEEMGVIVPIGRHVLQSACLEALSWPRTPSGGPAPSVHVNVSPVEMRDPGFVGGVRAALATSGLEPERLVLEITEGVVLDDPGRATAMLTQLRALGVQIALDDFGTGYSSLSQLSGLPLDWLKIGPPFVNDLGPDALGRPFVRMIAELAGTLGLRVVAEEIETRQQMQALQAVGCGFGQGFYLGAPAPAQPDARQHSSSRSITATASPAGAQV